MSLKERITADMKTAMKAHEADRLSTIRLLLSAIKQKEVDERIILDDAQILAIVEKLIKQRRDSIEQFERGARADLVAKEAQEIEVLQAYMPEQMSQAELALAVQQAIAASGAKTASDMGKVMTELKPRLAGRADMKQASALVKQALS